MPQDAGRAFQIAGTAAIRGDEDGVAVLIRPRHVRDGCQSEATIPRGMRSRRHVRPLPKALNRRNEAEASRSGGPITDSPP